MEDFFDYLKRFINGDLHIRFKDHDFTGICLTKYNKYPWKNSKEMDQYNKMLENEKTSKSFEEWKKLEDTRLLEKTHILLSWSFICLIFCYLIAFASIILFLAKYKMLSIILLSTGLLFLITFKLLRNKASNIYFARIFFLEVINSYNNWP